MHVAPSGQVRTIAFHSRTHATRQIIRHHAGTERNGELRRLNSGGDVRASRSPDDFERKSTIFAIKAA